MCLYEGLIQQRKASFRICSGFGNTGTYLLSPARIYRMNNTGCRPLSDSDWNKVLQGLQGRYCHRDAALIILGNKTGFRISELLSLRVCDVWDGTQVRPTVTVTAKCMKGKVQPRSVPLNPKAAAALEIWLRSAAMTGVQFANSPLFRRQGHRKSITTRRAFAIILAAVAGAGLDTTNVGTHSLRKTYASSCWHHPAVDRDMAKMAKLLGHRNFSNTLRYIQFLDKSLDTAIMEI